MISIPMNHLKAHLRSAVAAVVLVSYGAVSMPMQAIADQDALIQEQTVVVSDDKPPDTPASVVTGAQEKKEVVATGIVVPSQIPALLATERENATGYKVVRTFNKIPTTAYTSRPEETDSTPFTTADGSHVRDGIVAANFLPFGTKIRVPELYGDKIFEVHDRMNKRYWYKVDFWMADLQAARNHGVRYLTIEVVEEAADESVELADAS